MDLAAMRAHADELMTRFERMRSDVGGLQQKLKAVSVTQTSDDGLVTVTVGPRGQVIKVDFDSRIYRRPNSKELSATVTETIRRATEKAMSEVEELCRPFMPNSQFQAYIEHDLDGIFRQFDADLPQPDDTKGTER